MFYPLSSTLLKDMAACIRGQQQGKHSQRDKACTRTAYKIIYMYTYVCIYTCTDLETSPNKLSAGFIPPSKAQAVIAGSQKLNVIRTQTLITTCQDSGAAPELHSAGT